MGALPTKKNLSNLGIAKHDSDILFMIEMFVHLKLVLMNFK